MNHMRERHLDGTVFFRPSAGGIFEPLARPDLFITDADRANVITSRRKDRDAAMIGVPRSRPLHLRVADLPSQTPLVLPCRPGALFCCPVMLALGYLSYLCYLTNTGNLQTFATPYAFYLATVAKC